MVGKYVKQFYVINLDWFSLIYNDLTKIRPRMTADFFMIGYFDQTFKKLTSGQKYDIYTVTLVNTKTREIVKSM